MDVWQRLFKTLLSREVRGRRRIAVSEENTDYVFYYPEAGSNKFLQNIFTYPRSYKTMQATGCFNPVVSTKLHGVTFPKDGDTVS
jgi:hypothetical protein